MPQPSSAKCGNLGSGWSVSEFVGTFFPVNTDIGQLGIGGNFWTFTDLAGIAYNTADGWSLGANFTLGISGNNAATAFRPRLTQSTSISRR